MRRALVVLSCVSLILLTTVATPVASSSSTQRLGPAETEEPTLHVELSEDGDATVTLVSVYSFTESSERNSFESIRSDEQTQAEMLNRFADRIDAISADIEADRELSVTGDAIDLQSGDDCGIVSISVTWNGLAAVDGDSLVLDEPFASGFEPDRMLVVQSPDGSSLESSTPEPTVTDGEQAMWEANTELDGFEAVVASSSAEADDEDGPSDSTPGFGGIVGIGSVVTVLGLRTR